MPTIFWGYKPVRWTGYIVGRRMRPRGPAAVQRAAPAPWLAVRYWSRTERSGENWAALHSIYGFDQLPVSGAVAVAYRRVKGSGALVHQLQVVRRRGGVVRCARGQGR